MSTCPCDSGKDYDACCGPLISGSRPAPTAEALMRSRYSAFATGATDYITHTLHPDNRDEYDPAATKRWADSSEWLGLKVLNTSGGGTDDTEGSVEFTATFRQKGVVHTHHEVGLFSRLKGVWYYVDGKIITPGTKRNPAPKVGRNDPCPCGSGKKYKKCCGT
jgi:SEC-C motif-containing protein